MKNGEMMVKGGQDERQKEPGKDRRPGKIDHASGKGSLDDAHGHAKDQRPEESVEFSEDVMEVDARGLLCPEPVLLTARALAQMPPGKTGKLHVLVNTAAAKENVTRLAENKGHRVTAKAAGGDVLLVIQKQ